MLRNLLTYRQNCSDTKVPPHLEYIMAIEQLCHKLQDQEAEEIRLEVSRVPIPQV